MIELFYHYVRKTDGAVYGGTYASWPTLLMIIPEELLNHRWSIRPGFRPGDVTVSVAHVFSK